jgi:hypothetical protein
MTLAYSPIALATPSIEIEKLDTFMEARGEKHYTGCWYEAPLCGRVDDAEQLKEASYRDQAWARRFDPPGTAKVAWAQLGEELFPEVKRLLMELPFYEITYCNLLLQIKEVPPHLDLDHRLMEQAKALVAVQEPASYKWMLSGTDLKSFFVQKTRDDAQTRRHIQIPPQHSVFAIADQEAYHGADYFPEKRKYILSIFGILDPAKHADLLTRSIKEFKDFTIKY